MVVSLLVVVGSAPRAIQARADRQPSLAAVIDRARAALLAAQSQWAVVICEEQYLQEVWTLRRRYGVPAMTVAESRRLTSEFLLVWVDTASTWAGFRDVIAVDGRAEPDRTKRLESVLRKPGASLTRLGALADESARYNIGPVVRNFNEPTLALRVLDARAAGHFALRKIGETRIRALTAWEVEYNEAGRPTIIQREGRDAPVHGVLSIEPDRGVVVRTELHVEDPLTGALATIVVDYGPARDFGVWMPRRMKESYKVREQEITGTADYSKFRRFETSGRLVLPK